MKKLTPNFLYALLIAFTIIACKKSADSKIDDFIRGYNQATANIGQSNPILISSKAEKTAENEITISMKANVTSDAMEAQLLKTSFPQLLGQLLASASPKENLLDDGINFNIKIFDKDGKTMVSEKVDKSKLSNTKVNLDNFTAGNKPTQSDLNELLKVFNKNLPMTDPASGVKIIKIEAGSNSDIIYTAEVPAKVVPAFQMDGAKDIMKKAMLQQPQIRQILSQTSKLGIDKLRYKYMDEKGNLIDEIILNQSDVQ